MSMPVYLKNRESPDDLSQTRTGLFSVCLARTGALLDPRLKNDRRMCVKKATKSLSEKNNLTNTSTSGPAMPEDMIGMLSV